MSVAVNEPQVPSPTAGDTTDPIVTLLDQLATAADTGGVLSLGSRARLTVRRISAGFAIGREARP